MQYLCISKATEEHVLMCAGPHEATGQNSVFTINLRVIMCMVVFARCVCVHVWKHQSLGFSVEKLLVETMNLRLFVNLRAYLAHRCAPLSLCVP